MHDSTAHSPAPPSRNRLRWTGLAFGAVLIAIVVAGVAARESDARRLERWTSAQAVPTVRVSTVQPRAAASTLALPGRIEAFARAPIYARVSGYLKSWRADIGTHVKAGQLLAVIETPDLAAQLVQAQADLTSARANAALAAKTARRWESLVGSGLVSRQDTDQKISDLAAKTAAVKAAAANVERLQAMKRYARILAPFDGVVTARNTDVGQLINAGDNGQGRELFVVSDVRRLRVYVQVPQTDAPAIMPGARAILSVPGFPGRRFTAGVEAAAGAISASSGSTLVQLVMDNPGEQMLPGSFATVSFHLAASRAALQVPADALVFDRHGLRVALVGRDDRVLFRRVSIAHDDGDSVQIGSGLAAGDRVIDSPPDGLFDGDPVRIAARHEPGEPSAERATDARATAPAQSALHVGASTCAGSPCHRGL